jgi:parallel beta-helix repeat protein
VNNTISNNLIRSNAYSLSIYSGSQQNRILNNTFIDNRDGIHLRSGNDTICNNIFVNNSGNDIFTDTKIIGNTLTYDGFRLWDNCDCIIKNNTVNGKPLVYLLNTDDLEIESAGQVILRYCDNITISHQDLSHTSISIALINSSHCIIKYNILENNSDHCIYLYNSHNNTINNNSIRNSYNGIDILGSHQNTITNNNLSDNYLRGIWAGGSYDLGPSNYNLIADNYILTNEWAGIGISGKNNIIENNIIINNGYFDPGDLIFGNRNGGIVLFWDSCRNNTIQNNIINSNCYAGINFQSKNYLNNPPTGGIYNNIFNNTITNHRYGIIFMEGLNNLIKGNLFQNNIRGIHFFMSESNQIQYNTFNQNVLGIHLSESKSNTVTKNNFIDNIRSASFATNSSALVINRNTWDGNYWNIPRQLPKKIIGRTGFLLNYIALAFPLLLDWLNDLPRALYLYVFKLIPWINVDWHPAQEPYDIKNS